MLGKNPKRIFWEFQFSGIIFGIPHVKNLVTKEKKYDRVQQKSIGILLDIPDGFGPNPEEILGEFHEGGLGEILEVIAEYTLQGII